VPSQRFRINAIGKSGIDYVRCHTSCPARRRAPDNGLAAVTLDGAYVAVPARRRLRVRQSAVYSRSMVTFGVWSGCWGQVVPDVEDN
jgi:hypothetical protein